MKHPISKIDGSLRLIFHTKFLQQSLSLAKELGKGKQQISHLCNRAQESINLHECNYDIDRQSKKMIFGAS